MDRRTLLWTGGIGAVAVAAGVGVALRAPRRTVAERRGLASLSPAITETAFALGAGDRLVARTPWCTLPPEAEVLPVAGSALTPDLEVLAALAPSTILVDGSAAAQTEVLGRVAPVEVLPWLTLDELLASVARLGGLLDVDPAELVEALGTALTPPPGGATGPRLAVLLAGPELEQGGPFWFIKRASLHGTAIEAAGYQSAIGPWTGPPQLSVEGLIEADPEVVVVVSAAPPGEADADALLGALGALPLAASEQGALHLLEGPELLSVGPSILAFVDALRHLRGVR